MRFHLGLTRSTVRFLLLTSILYGVPATSTAQTRLDSPPRTPLLNSAITLARAASSAPGTVQHPPDARKSAIGWSVLAGVIAATSATAWAAQSYGENEGGKFCTNCFVQWGAVAIPAGAGIGALVGLAIDAARR